MELSSSPYPYRGVTAEGRSLVATMKEQGNDTISDDGHLSKVSWLDVVNPYIGSLPVPDDNVTL